MIYALEGGLTHFLFVAVAVQAVYLTPVRRWAPYLGTLAVLWLTLYLLYSPEAGAGMVATIGMYFLYLLFASLVTFTTVQQERQTKVAQALLEGVRRQHQTLRAYEQKVESMAEMEERERLAQTISASLLRDLTALRLRLSQFMEGRRPINRETAREARIHAKEALAFVRQTVRTLRPGETEDLDDGHDAQPVNAETRPPEIPLRWIDPIRVYHIWNVGVIVVTAGVTLASLLVAGKPQWHYMLLATILLLLAYGGTAILKQPWSRTMALVIQAGIIVWFVALSQEPLTSHLFWIIAAQVVFLIPPDNRWVVAAVAFPSILSGMALWWTNLFVNQKMHLLTLTAAFTVTYFFSAVMAYMTRREVEARQRAILYVQQLTKVNRLLEARVQQLRAMAIARERVRMSREIHDSLGHHLTVVIVELQFAEELAEEDQEAALQHMDAACKVVDAAMATSRELVESLDRFERPLDEALAELVATWQKENGPQLDLQINGDFMRLGPAARITLYRTVQESLTNIQKHARARRVEIRLEQMPDRVILTVVNDDGGGAPPPLTGRGGFGLVGLTERAEALRGQFTAGPCPEGGFQVKMVLPLGE